MATSGVEGGVTRRRTPVSSVNATAGGTTEQSSTMDPETPQPAAGAGAGAGGAMTAESPSPSMGGGASPTGKPSVRRIERSLEEESEQWKELINVTYTQSTCGVVALTRHTLHRPPAPLAALCFFVFFGRLQASEPLPSWRLTCAKLHLCLATLLQPSTVQLLSSSSSTLHCSSM